MSIFQHTATHFKKAEANDSILESNCKRAFGMRAGMSIGRSEYRLDVANFIMSRLCEMWPRIIYNFGVRNGRRTVDVT